MTLVFTLDFAKPRQTRKESKSRSLIPCPRCRRRQVMPDVMYCFLCEHKDPVFDVLDALIAAGVETSRAVLPAKQLQSVMERVR